MRSQTAFDRYCETTYKPAASTALALLRITLGLQLFLAGVEKIVTGWSAEGYLLGATGPLAEWFHSLAGSGLLSQLNVWGLTLVGLALILGLAVRPASFFGAIMMGMYYLAHFEQNTEHGLVDFHLVYIAIFLLFLCGGAGRFFGLDAYVSRVVRNKWIQAVLFG